MNKLDILAALLEKKKLSQQEKSELDLLLQDKELQEFYNIYNRIEGAVNRGGHLSIDEIRDYILIKNNLDPENSEVYSLSAKIETHIRKCQLCSDQFKVLNQEFSDIDTYISSQFSHQRENVSTPAFSSRFFRSRPLIAAMVVIGFLYLVVFSLSEFSTPENYRFAQAHNEEYYVTRGRATDDFQRSVIAIEERDFESAINFLEKDIQKDQYDRTIFYSHYILGITYLRASYSSFIGLFPSYDPEMVNKGVKHLSSAVDKNESGRFNNIMTESYFHLGRGYLMLNNADSAKYYFSMVVKEKGSKMKEAEEILRGIEN